MTSVLSRFREASATALICSGRLLTPPLRAPVFGSMSKPNLVFDSFWASDDALAFPITDEGRGYIQHKDFLDDPLLNPLGTASGVIEIYSETIARMKYDDCPPHPTWMEPIERLGGLDAKFPLHIDTKHP